jgi:WD40 repeat protein
MGEGKSDGEWRHTPVELRAGKAAACVEWSPDGDRFAVGLHSKDVAICYFEKILGHFVSKKVGAHNKPNGHQAAVRSLAWHPNAKFLATASTDRHCRVFDVNPEAEDFGNAELNEDTGAWVNAVAFSPGDGRVLAFAGQDSTIRFKDLGQGPQSAVAVVRWKRLPFVSLTFVGGERTLVACGYDCSPVLFRLQDNRGWEAVGSVDTAARPNNPKSMSHQSSFEASRALFKAQGTKDLKGRDDEATTTVHQNTITACSALSGVSFSTSGLDGQVVVWVLAAS